MNISWSFLALNVLFPRVTLIGLSSITQNSLRCLCFWTDGDWRGLIVRIFTVDFSFRVNCSNPPQGLLSLFFFIIIKVWCCFYLFCFYFLGFRQI